MVVAGGCASSTLYKTGEGNLGSILVLFSISFSQAWLVSTDWFSNWIPQSWAETAAAEVDTLSLVTESPGWFDQFTAGYLWQLRSEEHTSELQSRPHLVCRLLLEKKK